VLSADRKVTREELPFLDRTDGGRRLAKRLGEEPAAGPVLVVALGRGGLPAGREVARALGAELTVVWVQRLGVPWQPELTMGAVTATSSVWDDQVVEALRLSPERVQFALAKGRGELRRRQAVSPSEPHALDVRGREVLLVDDGAATGLSMIAALRAVRQWQPASLQVALPVASRKAYASILRECDQCCCLATPEPFGTIGDWYLDFRPVSDSDVPRLLGLVRAASPNRA
jgi:putative phosphoribosyl transferase